MAADKNASEFPHWLVKSTITQKHFLSRDVAKSRSYIQWISRCSLKDEAYLLGCFNYQNYRRNIGKDKLTT